MSTAQNTTPAWIRRTGVMAVASVAVVAAIVSFDHMRALAEDAGEGWKAWILPVSVDGMLVSASLVMLTRKRAGQPVGALAWIGLVLGLLVSLAANVAAAEPTLIGRLVAAWPPVALGLSYELLLSLVRRSTSLAAAPGERLVEPVHQAHQVPVHQPGDDLATEPHQVPGEDAHQPGDQPEPAHQVESANPVRQAGDDLVSVPRQPGDAKPNQAVNGDLVDLVSRARQVLATARIEGRQVGRTRLAKELAITEHQARQVLAEATRPHLAAVHTEPAEEVAVNA